MTNTDVVNYVLEWCPHCRHYGGVHHIDEGRCIFGEHASKVVYVAEGWWHPNVKSGQVHDHPKNPGRSWSSAHHSLCEPVYTRREESQK